MEKKIFQTITAIDPCHENLTNILCDLASGNWESFSEYEYVEDPMITVYAKDGNFVELCPTFWAAGFFTGFHYGLNGNWYDHGEGNEVKEWCGENAQNWLSDTIRFILDYINEHNGLDRIEVTAEPDEESKVCKD